MTTYGALLTLHRYSRSEARDRYREQYGVDVDDLAIDKEIEHFAWEDGCGGDTVTLPTRLVMALVFRGRSEKSSPDKKKAGTQPKEMYAKTEENLLVGWALGLKDKLAAGGMSKTEAELQAAEETLAMSKKTGLFRYAGINSADTLIRKMKKMAAIHAKMQRKKPL